MLQDCPAAPPNRVLTVEAQHTLTVSSLSLARLQLIQVTGVA